MKLYFKGIEVTPDLYAVEHIVNNSKAINFFSGLYSYQKAIIWCAENLISGKLVYCLTSQAQSIVEGYPIKRGRKKEIRLDDIKRGFETQLIEPPNKLKSVL
jgi:hypothetical protein